MDEKKSGKKLTTLEVICVNGNLLESVSLHIFLGGGLSQKGSRSRSPGSGAVRT